jgi:hypothetical protein
VGYPSWTEAVTPPAADGYSAAREIKAEAVARRILTKRRVIDLCRVSASRCRAV